MEQRALGVEVGAVGFTGDDSMTALASRIHSALVSSVYHVFQLCFRRRDM